MSDETKVEGEAEQAGETAPAAPVATTEIQGVKNQLEAEQALRVLAEEERDNAKKDIIAIKTGKKRGTVDLKEAQAAAPSPAPAPVDQTAIAAELAESRRVNAELARALQARGVAPSGGSGAAESPAPKPKGYWSEEQKAVLKKRGWSDDKITRAETTARNGSSTGPKYASDAGVAKRSY